jgi:hypothetical protein
MKIELKNHCIVKNPDEARCLLRNLINTALLYKYKDPRKVAIKNSDPKAVTEAIFKLTRKDKLKLNGEIIDGQKFKEVTITSMILPALYNLRSNSDVAVIATPLQEESYDTNIIFYNPDTSQVIDNTLATGQNSKNLQFQIKEDFDYVTAKNDFKEIEVGVDIHHLEELVDGVDEMTIVYGRRYRTFNTSDLDGFLKHNPNVFLIINHHSGKAINPGEKDIPYITGRMNFLILCWDEVADNVQINHLAL